MNFTLMSIMLSRHSNNKSVLIALRCTGKSYEALRGIRGYHAYCIARDSGGNNNRVHGCDTLASAI
jgi:hypothetical protein